MRIPRLCCHKKTGRAYVTLNQRQHYLGRFGTKAAQQAYDELIHDWLANDRRPLGEVAPCVTVAQLSVAYLKFAKTRYVKNGEVTGEVGKIKASVRVLTKLYPRLPANEFSPKKLRAVMDAMHAMGWGRNYINDSKFRVVRIFKFGAREEMFPANVAASLEVAESLRIGEAPEGEPVKPVSDALLEATLLHLHDVVADMVRVQRLTGMRPGEVCIMRPVDIDRTGDVWIYTPSSHKTEHHGKARIVALGPNSQRIISKYLFRDEGRYLFEHRGGTCYKRRSYRQAIQRACKQHGIDTWHPNQIRHTKATEVRRTDGLEGAQVVMGHSNARVTEHYAERDTALQLEIQKQTG